MEQQCGNHGVLNQASNSKVQAEIAEEKEIVQQASILASGKSKLGTIEKDKLDAELSKYPQVEGTEQKNEDILVKFKSNRVYSVNSDGDVKLLPEATGISFATETESVLKGETLQLIPTLEPLGATGKILYTSSDTTKATVSDSGLVTGVAKGTATITATVNGKSAEITINVTTDTLEPGQTATGGNKPYESDGKTAVIPENFTVSSTESSINSGLVVIGPDGSEFVWIPIDKDTLNPIGATAVLSNKEMAEQIDGKWRGILYTFSGSGTNITTSKLTYSTSSYREPDDVSADSSNGITETALQTEYDAIINSVKSNGGFYVGRYESSLDGSNKIQSKGGLGIKPTASNNANTKNWYGLYTKQQTYAGNETGKTYTVTTDKVKSTMITGACYDAILNWALNSGNDSVKVMQYTNGNHQGSSVGAVDCGSFPNDKINNIFDLEGNVYEWTSEAKGTKNRVYRGRQLL